MVRWVVPCHSAVKLIPIPFPLAPGVEVLVEPEFAEEDEPEPGVDPELALDEEAFPVPLD